MLQTARLCSWWFALITVKRQVHKVTLSLRVSSPHNQCKTVLRFTIKQRIESRPISVCVASFPRAVTHRRCPGNSELPWNFHPGARQRFLAHVGHHVPLRTMLAFALHLCPLEQRQTNFWCASTYFLDKQAPPRSSAVF